MRNAFFILLLAFMASLGASMLIWRNLAFPALPALPPGPNALQRSFGMHMTSPMTLALTRPMPDGFVTAPDLGATIETLRDATTLNIFVNWRALEAVGLGKESKVLSRNLGGMTVGDAILKLLADQPSPLACVADDDVLTITTLDDASKNTVTRVYDVRNLLNASQNSAALEADIKSTISPGSWRSATTPRATHSIRGLSGQLIVTASPFDQHALLVYLNELQKKRIRVEFAKRAAAVVGPAMLLAAMAVILRAHLARQRRLSIGLCPKCGYDLRATSERCPECGLAVTT